MINFIEREEQLRFNRVHGVVGTAPVFFKGGGGPPTYVAPKYTTLTPGELGSIDFQKINVDDLKALVFEELTPEDIMDLKVGKIRPGELKNAVFERLQDKGLTTAQLQRIEQLPEMELAKLDKLPELQLQQLADLKQVKLEKLGEQPDLKLDRSAKDDVSTVYGDEFGRQKDVLGTLAATTGEANRLDDEELAKRLDRTAPGLRDSIARRLKATESLQKGQLSTEQLDEIFKQARITGAGAGLRGDSEAQKNLTFRDLGRSVFDVTMLGDSRVGDDRALAESLRGGTMKVGDQLLSTREILNRRDREYEDNLAASREEQRDKVLTSRQRNLYNNQLANQEIMANTNLENQRSLLNNQLTNEQLRTNDQRAVTRQLANTDLENEMRRDKVAIGRQTALANIDLTNRERLAQNQLDNQAQLFDIGLTNQERETMAGLRNQELVYNLAAQNAEDSYRAGQFNNMRRSNLALRNQSTAVNTAGINASYLENINIENRKRGANLGFRQTETMTNLNIKNKQAEANANAANANAQAQYEYNQRNGGSPFGSLFGGMGGAIVGGLVGSIVAPGAGTLVGAGLGMSMGGGIGGSFGGAQGQGMGGILSGAGGMLANFGGMLMPAAAAPTLLNSFNVGTGAATTFNTGALTTMRNNPTYDWLGSTSNLDFSFPEYFK